MELRPNLLLAAGGFLVLFLSCGLGRVSAIPANAGVTALRARLAQGNIALPQGLSNAFTTPIEAELVRGLQGVVDFVILAQTAVEAGSVPAPAGYQIPVSGAFTCWGTAQCADNQLAFDGFSYAPVVKVAGTMNGYSTEHKLTFIQVAANTALVNGPTTGNRLLPVTSQMIVADAALVEDMIEGLTILGTDTDWGPILSTPNLAWMVTDSGYLYNFELAFAAGDVSVTVTKSMAAVSSSTPVPTTMAAGAVTPAAGGGGGGAATMPMTSMMTYTSTTSGALTVQIGWTLTALGAFVSLLHAVSSA